MRAREPELPLCPTRIPAGVRETIGRRLMRLSARCNDLLGVAAVYGRQFTAREIAAAANEDVQVVLTGLEPALQAGIVQCNAEVAGSYQFTHALIRETIYEELPTSDRLRMHGRAGDALVSVHSAHLEPALTRIAHHYHAAALARKPRQGRRVCTAGRRQCRSDVRIRRCVAALRSRHRDLGKRAD